MRAIPGQVRQLRHAARSPLRASHAAFDTAIVSEQTLAWTLLKSTSNGGSEAWTVGNAAAAMLMAPLRHACVLRVMSISGFNDGRHSGQADQQACLDVQLRDVLASDRAVLCRR